MKFIKPKEISGTIMTLMDETEEHLIITSPYNKLSKWYKLINCFKDLKNKNIPIDFFVRKGETESIGEVKELGIEPIEVPNLHCKLYMNEKHAIVTSMNLLLSSEINSLEMAYMTETAEELEELKDFTNRYLFCHKVIAPEKEKTGKSPTDYTGDFLHTFKKAIEEKLQTNVNLYWEEEQIKVKTPINNYDVFIARDGKNILSIGGILSKNEFEFGNNSSFKFDTHKACGLVINLMPGTKGYYNMVWGWSKQALQTESLKYVLENEVDFLTESASIFITYVENLKLQCRG